MWPKKIGEQQQENTTIIFSYKCISRALSMPPMDLKVSTSIPQTLKYKYIQAATWHAIGLYPLLMTMPRQAYLPLLQQGADLLDGASEVGEPTNKNYEQATQIEEPNQQEGLI